MRTRNEKSARNVWYIIWKQIFLLFLNFLAKTVFIKVMGKEYLGLNGIFNNIFFLFSFAEFGMGTAMVYSFYEPFATGNKDKCAALYSYFRKLYIGMSMLLVLAGLAVIPFLSWIIDLEMPLGKVILYYLLYMAGTFFSNFFLYNANLLVADQNQYLVTRIQIIMESVCLLLQIVVIWKFKSFELYLGCLVLKSVGCGLLYTRKVHIQYPYIADKQTELTYEEKRPILGNTKTLFIYKFTKTLINSTDNIIISILIGTVWVGMYSNYEFVITGVWSLVTAVFSAVSASVGNLIVEKGRYEQYKIYRVIEMINVWIAGFTATCLAVLFQDFITLWIGASYRLNIMIMALIVLNYYLKCMREGICMFREAAGMFHKFKNVTLVTAVLNIMLSVILGCYWGISGIFAATVIAVLATYFWYEPYLVYREQFQMPVAPYFRRQLKNIALTVVILLLTYGVSGLITLNGISGFVLKAGICSVLPNLCYLLFFGRGEEFKILWGMMTELITRRKQKDGRNN